MAGWVFWLMIDSAPAEQALLIVERDLV